MSFVALVVSVEHALVQGGRVEALAVGAGDCAAGAADCAAGDCAAGDCACAPITYKGVVKSGR